MNNSTETKPNQTAVIRDEKGLFQPGTQPGPGRQPMTEEEKAKKKALEKVIEKYIEDLTNALPAITPTLISKAREGDLTAIKEVNDRVMGKARQNIGLDGGDKDKPISITGITYIQPNGNSDNPNNKATPSVGGSEE